MKFRYLASTILSLAVAASASLAKTGTEEPQQKTIAPFVKKKESDQRIAAAPRPLPVPQAYGTRRTSISGRNYIGGELGITSSTLFNANDYFIPAVYPNMDADAAEPLVYPISLKEYQPGIGFLIGGVVDFAFSNAIGLQGKVTFRNHTFGASAEDTLVDFDGDVVPLTNEYTGSLNFVGIDALLRLQFAEDGLYGLGGFGFSSLLGNSNTASQVAGEGFTYNFYPSGIPTESNRLDFESQSLEDFFNTSRLDAKLGVGTFIPVGDNGMVLTPELIVGIPLTAFHTSEFDKAYRDADIDPANMLFATLSVALKFPWGNNGTSSSSSYDGGSSSGSSNNQPVEAGKAMLSGRVVDNAGEPIDDATVTVVDLNNNQVVATDETDDGMYNVKVNAPGRYSVTADAPGYLFGSALFEVDKDGRILKSSGDIKLAPSTDGRVRLLVFFDFDKATLQSASYPELNRAVALMKANPNMRVEIAGFTDAQGTDAYNKDLSQRRANAVREYLVRQGVEGLRLTAVGYGEDNPVATNDTEDGRAENRRVEFVVVKR